MHDGSRLLDAGPQMTRAPNQFLTLNDVADELGVHYMTVYKYVRQGRLRATKQGLQWIVTRVDLDAFRDPAGKTRSTRRQAPWNRRLEDRLLAGDNQGSWEVATAALSAGKSPIEFLLDVLSPALASVGEKWAEGEISVADEHRASAAAMRLLGRLSPQFTRRGRPRGTVILGTGPRELHSLPVSILADVLRGSGFSVIDLGCNVPVDSLAATVREAMQDPGSLLAVLLSATSPELDREVGEAVAAVREASPTTPVFVGGRAMDEAKALELGADGDGRTALEALEHLEAAKAGFRTRA